MHKVFLTFSKFALESRISTECGFSQTVFEPESHENVAFYMRNSNRFFHSHWRVGVGAENENTNGRVAQM